MYQILASFQKEVAGKVARAITFVNVAMDSLENGVSKLTLVFTNLVKIWDDVTIRIVVKVGHVFVRSGTVERIVNRKKSQQNSHRQRLQLRQLQPPQKNQLHYHRLQQPLQQPIQQL